MPLRFFKNPKLTEGQGSLTATEPGLLLLLATHGVTTAELTLLSRWQSIVQEAIPASASALVTRMMAEEPVRKRASERGVATLSEQVQHHIEDISRGVADDGFPRTSEQLAATFATLELTAGHGIALHRALETTLVAAVKAAGASRSELETYASALSHLVDAKAALFCDALFLLRTKTAEAKALAAQETVGLMGQQLDGIRALAKQSLRRSNEVTSALPALTKATTTQAESAGTLTSDAVRLAATCQTSLEAIAPAAELTGALASQLRDSANALGHLAQGAEKLKESVSASVPLLTAFDELSSQANLLALNIAVETSRIGESANGLTKMADSARALAVRSAESGSTGKTALERAMGLSQELAASSQPLSTGASHVHATVQDANERATSACRTAQACHASSQQLNEGLAALTGLARSSASAVAVLATTAAELHKTLEALGQASEQRPQPGSPQKG